MLDKRSKGHTVGGVDFLIGILPEELIMYQKEQGPQKHNIQTLNIQEVEIVQMGDANVEAYTMAMEKMAELGKSLAKVNARDGMSIEERSKINNNDDNTGSLALQSYLNHSRGSSTSVLWKRNDQAGRMVGDQQQAGTNPTRCR